MRARVCIDYTFVPCTIFYDHSITKKTVCYTNAVINYLQIKLLCLHSRVSLKPQVISALLL